MKNLLLRCWNKKPENRPSFQEIFEELSNDIESYIKDKIDIKEIQTYLKSISEWNKNYSEKEMYLDIKKEEEKILDKKIQKLKEKNNSLIKSDIFFHEGLQSILKNENDKAIEEFKISSKNGNCYASFILGCLYDDEKKNRTKY